MIHQNELRILRQAELSYVVDIFVYFGLIIVEKSETEEITTQMLDDAIEKLLEEMHNSRDRFVVLTTGQYNMDNNHIFVNMDCSLWKRRIKSNDREIDPILSSTIAVCMFSDSTKELQYITFNGHSHRGPADNYTIDSSFVQIPLIAPSPNPNWVPVFLRETPDESCLKTK